MRPDQSIAILGETRGMNPINEPEDFRTGILALARQVQRTVKVFSQCLDHDLYDLEALGAELGDIITERQKLTVRILVKDTTDLVRGGHRLVALHQRLPSYVFIHRFPEEAWNDREEYVIFDDIGIIKRYPRTEFKGYFEFRTADAAVKGRHFDSLWERSEACRELQQIRV